MSDLNELLERVRAATGPDRELDFELHDAITGRSNQYAPAYTFSVSESLRLAEERVLEDWPDILRAATRDLGKMFHWHIARPKLGQLDMLPLAILAATLESIIAQPVPVMTSNGGENE